MVIGRVWSTTFFAAVIAGFIARRAKTAWGLLRIGAVWLLAVVFLTVLQVAQLGAKPHPLAERKAFLQGVRRGYLEIAPDAPNLPDPLAELLTTDIADYAPVLN